MEQHTASINCETFSDGLTEKKNILQQVKSRLVKVKEEIELLNSTNNKSTSFLAKDAKEAFVLYTVTQRISLLSMVNIQNHQFVSIGSTKVSESALDNLIKVILEIKKGYRISAYNFVVAADCNRSQEFLKSLDVEIKSIRTLPYDLHDEPISQSLVDEIEGRIKMKDIRSDSSTNRCVLLTEDISQLRLNPDDCIIYEHQNNFVVLKPDVGLDSINERAHVVINNLLNDQLLCMICQMAYRSSGLEMHKRELNSLYSTYKDTLCLLKDNNDEELFLQFIGDLKALTCTEKIISSHIHKLITLYTNVNKYSREYFSVKSGLICLQESFINRMESTVDEESERRKLESEAHIYDDFLMNSKLDKELRIKQDELDSMIEELKNKQEELSKKEKILQKDVNDLKQISIINNKQSKTIQDELSALKVELKEQKKNLLKLESNNLKDKKNDIKKKSKK